MSSAAALPANSANRMVDQIVSDLDKNDSPEDLIGAILKWEGLHNHAQLISYRAMQKLRSLHWQIPKCARGPEFKAKRTLIKAMLKNEYQDASEQSLTVYTSNFIGILGMDDQDFEKLDRISITNSNSRKNATGYPALNNAELDSSASFRMMQAQVGNGGGDDDDDDDADDDDVHNYFYYYHSYTDHFHTDHLPHLRWELEFVSIAA